MGNEGVLVHNSCVPLSSFDFPSWKKTHPPGTLNDEYVEELIEMLQNGDLYDFYRNPIITTTYEDVTYLIDGHHRIEAATQMGYTGAIQHTNVSPDQLAGNTRYNNIQQVIDDSF